MLFIFIFSITYWEIETLGKIGDIRTGGVLQNWLYESYAYGHGNSYI